MYLSWQDFLKSRPSKSPKINAKMILTPLPLTSVLSVTGQDAPTFLQGQTTCDVRQMNPYSFCPGAFCNPQGRVIATFWMLRDEQGFRLLIAADLVEKLMQRLRLYILRSQVALAVDELALFGVTVADSDSLKGVLPHLPQAHGAAVHAHRLFWLRMPPPGERWLVLGPSDAAQAMWLRLVNTLGAAEFPVTYWQLEDIRAGLPTVTAVTSESFLPQMLNLDRIGGISFAKGCYTGQEIIARTHYRGQVKRRLYRLGLSHPEALAPGTPLLVGEEPAGQVVNAAPCELGQEFLAVVRCELANAPELRAAGYESFAVHWLELAYA